MKMVTVDEAKTRISELLAEVANGEVITICPGGDPVEKPAEQDHSQRPRLKVGAITSEGVSYKEGCFDPLSDAELTEWGL